MNRADCIIIGAGPAGLMAGIYLARFRRKIKSYDTANSRASCIPCSHNYPGFPEGISGQDLLDKLRQHASLYNVSVIPEAVESLEQCRGGGFLIKSTHGLKEAKNIILCSGVRDIEPDLPQVTDGIQKGLIRHCPICDAYEVIDKKIAVIGDGKSGLGEALFLRNYTREITLITLGKESSWSQQDLKQIREAEINVISFNVLEVKLSKVLANITFSNHMTFQFDCIYSALGSVKNIKLAYDVNAKIKNGDLLVNKYQQTSIKGLFAAGDIVAGLSQICVATSQAAVAATAIHAHCL